MYTKFTLLALLLAGCATAPTDLEREGVKKEVSFVGDHVKVAHCLAGRLDDAMPLWLNQVRPLPDGTMRVMQYTGPEAGTPLMADLRRDGKAILMAAPTMISADGILDRLAKMVRQCDGR